ncbi:unnamed protein product [Vicia faba]|uniref:Uncharacterized protein n=1 Tax=Vicia faba TaxID=3906 RepID=A0AAV0ZPV9_VICFA|nr:unnamed protein product [Vicia faba]
MGSIDRENDTNNRLQKQVSEEEEEERFGKKLWIETKKLWVIVGPAILSSIASFTMNVVSQAFAGHLGEVQLASITIANTVIVGFNFGLLLGMASALETLCGQAFGAKRHNMLGIYLQRSWIVLFFCVSVSSSEVSTVPAENSFGCFMVGIGNWDVWVHSLWGLSFDLEWILLLMTGRLENATVAVDALSVCMTINGWEMMIPFAFFAGTGVRVANELGAGKWKSAKFAIIVLNSVQPVLSGVAVGSGWQVFVAYVNIGCYYLIGLPLGIIMGWVFNTGVEGIWGGMLFGGTLIQTLILIIITVRCDWEKEAGKANSRVNKGSVIKPDDQLQMID